MKGLLTVVLCIVTAVLLLGQPKKPPQKSGAGQTNKATGTTKTTGGMQVSIERGKEVYTGSCMACHQQNGAGVPRLNPPLAKTTYVNGDKKRLIGIVLKGMNQPIEIDDEEYTNAMPGLPHLSDQQIADVLTYVRNNFGNKASVVTPAEVKSVRATIK
jgi:mono/diheme cytochrome c family protein